MLYGYNYILVFLSGLMADISFAIDVDSHKDPHLVTLCRELEAMEYWALHGTSISYLFPQDSGVIVE